MGTIARNAKRSGQRTLLKQAVVWGLVLGGISLVKATSVSAHTRAGQQQPPAASPPVSQQTPAAASAAASSAALPDGPGKDTLLRVCTKCHSATQVMANRRDRQGWEDTITKMAGMGAAADDAQFSEILEYLVKNFSPLPATKINVNKATVDELVTLGITTKDAQAIVAYREKSGPFTSLDDLKKVPEIDVKKVDAVRDQLAF